MVRITKWFMLGATIIIVAYDVLVATNSGKGDTISEISLAWAWNWPTLPLVWGVLVGHLFWPVFKVTNRWPRIYVLGGIIVVTLAVDIFWLSNIFPLIPLLVGVNLGHVLWPQEKAR